MKLTDKCKKDFEKWLLNEWMFKDERRYNPDIFNQLPFSMQYGVYVDFFDSVGMFISIEPMHSITHNEDCVIVDTSYYGVINYELENIKKSAWHLHPSYFRKKIRKQAILVANEIYNEKNT